MVAFISSFLRRIRRDVRSPGVDTFHSFERPLTQLIRSLQPLHVAEFGPGRSTELFVQQSNAEIWSFETSREWYDTYKNRFDPARVHLIFVEDGGEVGEILQHSGTTSLVFIDGGDRLRALSQAYDLVGQSGAAYLHDAHREEYELGIRLYPFVYFPERHSCIMCRDEQVYRRVKGSVAADYSCDCQYCSSPARRAYFERMSLS